MPGARGSTASGKVDAVADVAVLEELAQRVGHHDRAVLLGLAGRGAQVRQRHDPRVVLRARCSGSRRRRRAGGRQSSAATTAASSTIGARAKFSIDAALAHELQARRVDQAAGVRRCSGTCTLIASERANRSSSDSACSTLRGQLPGALHGDLRIVAEHLHAQRLRRVGDLDADGAEADDAERAARAARSRRTSSCPSPPPHRWRVIAARARARRPRPGRCCAPPGTGPPAPAP